MNTTKLSEIMGLKEKPLNELQAKYAELFPGQQAPSNNKVYLWRKIVYRLQELEYGGISSETQDKIQELIRRCSSNRHTVPKHRRLIPFGSCDLHVDESSVFLTKGIE